jgi:hypothetical protein
MINTTGIQSTGPQGLPGSSSQPATADDQRVAQFDAMMSEPVSTSKLDELEAKLNNIQERFDKAVKSGDLDEASKAADEMISIGTEISKLLNTATSDSNKSISIEDFVNQFGKILDQPLTGPNKPILTRNGIKDF